MSNRVADQHASFEGPRHTIKVANYANVERLDELVGLDLKTSSTSFKDWTLNLHIARTCRDTECMVSDVAKTSLAAFLFC